MKSGPGTGAADTGDTPAPAIDVLWRDESAWIVSKPAGMLVHRSREAIDDGPALLQTVRDLAGCYVYAVHRLDRPASGILVFALTSEDAARWQEAVVDPATEKIYLAMVRGEAPEAFCVERPLKNDRGNPQDARTTFERVVSFGGFSLVTARLHTGRRHQIRRHLAHNAHQIVGDSTYGKGRINQWLRDEHGLPRLFLHATRLRVKHPVSGESLDVRCPLPDDLRTFLHDFESFPTERLANL